MRLDNERESENVEDRRGDSGGGLGRVGGLGIGGVLVALVLSYFTGIDPRTLLGMAESVQGTQQSAPESGDRAGYDEYKRRKGSKVHAAVDTPGWKIRLNSQSFSNGVEFGA